MAKLDLSPMYEQDDKPINEQVVRIILERMRRGLAVERPCIAEWKDGRVYVVDGRCRSEAARRHGGDALEYVRLNGDEIGIEKLRALRRKINRMTKSLN